MTIDARTFFRATEPNRTIVVNRPEDRKYYIDFSSVRGGDIISKIKRKISFFWSDDPTCTLFTGHIGCGKSVELFRLQKELEEDGFHVIYFESDQHMEVRDVDISDVLLAIAYRVSKNLEEMKIVEPQKLKQLLRGAWDILNSEVTGFKLKPTEGLEFGFSSDEDKYSLSLGIGEITSRTKNDAKLREKLNQYLGPQKVQLLNAINQELLEPAIVKLKEQGKKGLVVIVDNLDRISSSPKFETKSQQEYLFIDQGEILRKVKCHIVYTMPLALKFSNNYGILTQYFDDPTTLPMVPIKLPDGRVHEQGMALMQEMVLARAFPDLSSADRLSKIPEIFDSQATLERLCMASGGHVRDLLRLLNKCIFEEMALPISRDTLENVITDRHNDMVMVISNREWGLLHQVQENKWVSDYFGYKKLIQSRFVFEYRDKGKVWFDVNPILAEADKLYAALG